MSVCRTVLFAAAITCGAVMANAQTVQSSGSVTLRVRNAVAGSAPTLVTDATSSYRLGNTNGSNSYKLTARLSSAMPTGTTLTLAAVAPSGATSVGTVTLDATTRDIVTGVINPNSNWRTFTYTLSATSLAGVVSQQTRSVTITFIASP